MWNPPVWNRRRLDPPGDVGETPTHLSEVHVGGADGAARDVITRFVFFPPPGLTLGRGEDEVEEQEEEDVDGDLLVPRKKRRTDNQQCITVRHHMATSLPDVGLQVRAPVAENPPKNQTMMMSAPYA